MTEIKLGYRNLKRDLNVYMLLIVSSAIFIALIISFQSTITSGDLGKILSSDTMSDTRLFFTIILWMLASTQYIILYFFFNSYYRFINKIRVRELAMYKVIGYSRSSIKKIIFTESVLVYLIITILGIILSFFFNHIIINFVNTQMQLTTKLVASLSLKTIIITSLILLVISINCMYRTYRKACKLDIDIALSDAANQKKIIPSSKLYIIISFILGLILIANMSLLSTTVTFNLRFGIIIMAIFYAFGLFLIINAITKGYQYLITTKYKQKEYNLLLVSEINFHLNKSKFVILSSVILMMLSIGALLLSQSITDVINKTIGEYDYAVYDDSTSKITIFEGNWSLESKDGYEFSTDIYSIEQNQEILDELGITLNDNTLLSTKEEADEYGLEEGQIVTYTKDDESIDFTTKIVDDDIDFYAKAFMPLDDILNNQLFKNTKQLYDSLQILNKEEKAGNISNAYIEELMYFKDGMEHSFSIVSESNYNQYLNLIGEKPISLEGDEVWEDGFVSDNTYSFNIIGKSYTGVDAIIVDDDYYDDYKQSANDFINLTMNSKTLYVAKNKTELARIDQELENINDNSSYGELVINSIERTNMLGSVAFILLIAFYIAIIFIVCNFTLLAINLLSHGIENKEVYKKLIEMGMSKAERAKYISVFIRSFYAIPLVIGISSGIIATNFAIHLMRLFRSFEFSNILLLAYILFLYIIAYIIFINITKYIYKRIVTNK